MLAVGEGGGAVERAARGERGVAEAALERGLRLGRAQLEDRRVFVVILAGPEAITVLGASESIAEQARGRRLVGADGSRRGPRARSAVGQRAGAVVAVARLPVTLPEAALVGDALVLGRDELEARLGVRGEAGRAAEDRGVRDRALDRAGVDGGVRGRDVGDRGEVTPANCVTPWAGDAGVMAIRWPLRWATVNSCSPLSWPAIVHGPVQVCLPSAMAGSSIDKPLLEPGM